MLRQLIEYKNKSFFEYKSAINSTTHREFISELIALFYLEYIITLQTRVCALLLQERNCHLLRRGWIYKPNVKVVQS